MADYRERAVEPLVDRLLGELPALLIVGPRATGKTTMATRHASTVIRLDRPAESAAVRADPDAALRGLAEPVLIDEWQVVPDVLGAVKRAVDADARPGRYLLTGSVRAELDTEAWPGTGRLVRLPMFGMSVREQLGRLNGAPLIDRLASGSDLEVPPDPPDLRGYVQLALASGFPHPVLNLSDDTRRRWLESYVEQLVTRDAMDIERGRDPERLRRYLESYALNSAGVPEEKTLYQSAGVNRKTAIAYERLLSNLLMIERMPAWTSNRLKRLVRTQKRYLVDPGLFAGILRIDVQGVLKDGDLLGRLLDTFVASQVRSELPLTESRPRLYHLRTEQGRQEVDLLAELAGGSIVGIEVKADAGPKAESGRHLAWLRERLGERFVGGVVLHTGPRVYALDERIIAAPICTLWS
ncbi:MAG: ATP-binding protein [Actinomycetota bacterium]